MTMQMIRRFPALISGMAVGAVLMMTVMPLRMNDTWYLVDRTAYSGGRNPQPDDLVIVENAVFTEAGEEGRLVGRVFGAEGDRIQIEGGRLKINGADAMDRIPEIAEFPEDMTTVIVMEDHLFVLSEDVRGLDSRSEAVDQVDLDDVWGRVVYTRKEN